MDLGAGRAGRWGWTRCWPSLSTAWRNCWPGWRRPSGRWPSGSATSSGGPGGYPAFTFHLTAL